MKQQYVINSFTLDFHLLKRNSDLCFNTGSIIIFDFHHLFVVGSQCEMRCQFYEKIPSWCMAGQDLEVQLLLRNHKAQ
jgi:hypothetical protein